MRARFRADARSLPAIFLCFRAAGGRNPSGVKNPVVLSETQRDELRRALAAFDFGSQSRGKEYLRRGAVRELRILDDGTAFEANVQGGSLYSVEWSYGKGWEHTCDCPIGFGCKHAFAAAMAVLQNGAQAEPPAPVFASTIPLFTLPPPADPPEVQKLAELLEQRHGRPLTRKERAFLRELNCSWLRLRSTGSLYEHDLRPFGLDRHPGYLFNPNTVISGWWDAADPVATPLEFWQYLALYAERNELPVSELMRPLTDTTQVCAKVETQERRQLVAHWSTLFNERVLEAPVLPDNTLPAEIRLRLTSPKLTWECRKRSEDGWQAARGAQVRDWFTATALNPAGIPPATLALLQEVQLRRTQTGYWSSTEPQTLKLDDPTTFGVLHWLVVQPAMLHLLVNGAGESFDPERMELHWSGRPLPHRTDDVVFELVCADGSTAPAGLLHLAGEPPLALGGHTVFVLPPPLAGHGHLRVVVPREALLTTAAVRRLHRVGARVEGIDMPAVEVVRLRPRFVCRLCDEEYAPPGSLGRLEVEAIAFAPDGGLTQKWNGQAWTTLPKAGASTARVSDGKTVRDYVHADADAAIGLLAGLQLMWAAQRRAWVRRAATKNFPEDFAVWATGVRKAGVDLECDPLLAGLLREPDRARVEVRALPVGEEAAEIDWFDLQVVVRAEDAALTDEEIQLLLKARGRFVRLPGKGWRRLQIDLGVEETARLAELGIDAAALESPTERQRFHALQLADERIAGLLPEAHAERIRERAGRLRAIAPPPIPGGLTAELRPYQREGFHFLVHLASNGLGGVLADDMGLGKTVQALAWLLHLAGEIASRTAARPVRALVVCPKSVMSNWELETRRFAPALTTAPLRSRTEIPAGANLIVANYAQLRLAAAALGAVAWDAVILDEGQNIKNPQSQTARVARDLRASHRLVLTGTPIENRALDLWSLFAFAMPGLLGSQTAFKRGFNDKTDPLARARLARRVRHFMLRRTKSQVAADLPPRVEEDIFVDLEGMQRKLYDAELKRARAMLLGVTTDREFDRKRFNILQSLLRLRQICCDPLLVGMEAPAASGPAQSATGDSVHASAGSAKMEALLETLESVVEEGHRVLVFSQFVSMLELIAVELTARSIGHLMLTGQTENRQSLVDRFQSPEGEPVFLLSLKAAGAGLNLTAASYVVLYDPWWNPAVEAQAIDRTHRIGQKEQVNAYRLLARNTIEEKIRKLQQAKAELARAIVQEENVATVMSLDDLRFVLSE